jgi:bacillithiol system protein YtxJ
MSTRMRSSAELEAALAAPRYLLFKHSTRCPISAAAFEEYRIWCGRFPDEESGWIDVIEDRALSLLVAGRTKIGHESPQAILLSAGRPVWTASHGAITFVSLTGAVAAHAARPTA